ncbi:MAG: hypothetical protein K6G25_02455 [Bacteroidales bacterium]|nr:hypothetical protein [Bacteroidales bacterium]
MNNREGVNRKKEYYDWLKAVVAEPLDEDYKASITTFMGLDSVSDEAKETIKFSTEVFQPFGNALAYIVNNRFIIEDKAFLMENDTDDPPMTPHEIFAVLDYLIPSTVREFLGVLKVDSVVMEKLFGLWLDDDVDGFSALLQKENCDLTRISRLCRCCWDDTFSVSEIPNAEVPMMIDALTGTLKHSEKRDEQQVKDSADQMLESIEEIEAAEEDGEDYDLEKYFRDYRQFCEDCFRSQLFRYWDWEAELKPREIRIIEPVLEHPLAVELVKHFRVEYEESQQPQPSEPFTLPKDFFDWSHNSGQAKEYLYLGDSVRRKGVETFVAFINWLADKGYIADNNEVKALFAYRLTGRCRPEGKDLPVIEWHGKNGKSYELIYLVRFLSDRGDYRKMRRFFTGPEWVKDRDSSYANSADSDFRRQMSEFYPEVCRFVG